MSNFFDPSQNEFSVSMRGYDRVQVDGYARRMAAASKTAQHGRTEAEGKLSEVRNALRHKEERIATLERRLSDTAAQIAENEQPTLAGLGARVEKMLRAAERDADEQRVDAKQQATHLRSVAETEAAKVTDAARDDAAELTATAVATAAELTVAVKSESRELVESARRDYELARNDAVRDAEQKRSQAMKEVAELKDGAERQIAVNRATMDREATQLRAAAARDADEQRAAAATMLAEVAEARQTKLQELILEQAERRERAERDHSRRHTDAVTAGQRAVAEAEERWSLADQRSRLTHQKAEDRETEADHQASELAASTEISVAGLLAEARVEADRLRAEAHTAAAELVHPLAEEVLELQRRRDSVSSNLDDLRRQLGMAAGGGFDDSSGRDTMPMNPPRQAYKVETPTQQIPSIS